MGLRALAPVAFAASAKALEKYTHWDPPPPLSPTPHCVAFILCPAQNQRWLAPLPAAGLRALGRAKRLRGAFSAPRLDRAERKIKTITDY